MLRALLNRLEQASALDPMGDKLRDTVQSTVRPRKLKDALHGVFLGHPLHPVLVQAPVGAFLSAAILDLMPGQRRAATALVATGVGAAVPAALAGLTDWSSLGREQRRVGLVHAAGNSVALGLYAASLAARLRGRHGTGKWLGFAGLSLAGASAYLGGHLSYKEGAAVSHAAPLVRLLPEGWQSVGSLASLPEGKPVVRTVGSAPVLLYRYGDNVSAMIEHCVHQGGPLGEGTVTGSGAAACVVCPWHDSTFRLTDGIVVRGPAASDQPMLRTRVAGGQVEVSAP